MIIMIFKVYSMRQILISLKPKFSKLHIKLLIKINF